MADLIDQVRLARMRLAAEISVARNAAQRRRESIAERREAIRRLLARCQTIRKQGQNRAEAQTVDSLDCATVKG